MSAERDDRARKAVRRRREAAAGGVAALLVLGLLPLHPSPAAATVIGAVTLAAVPLGTLACLWVLSRERFRWDKRYLVARTAQEDAHEAALAVELNRLREEARDPGTPPASARATGSTAALSPEERRLLANLREYSIGVWLLRVIGPAITAVGFLTWWSGMYLLLWGLDSEAFTGLSPSPRVGEFIYIAVTATLGGTPEGIVAATGWSQMGVASELLSAVVVVSLVLQALMEPRRPPLV